jgi:hypothetical protein
MQLTRLGGRQAGLRKHVDHLICEVSLLSWKRRRVTVVPAQPRTNVCVEPHLLARDLVCKPVELLHLLEQGLELIVVDWHVGFEANVLDQSLAHPHSECGESGCRQDLERQRRVANPERIHGRPAGST